MHCTYWRRVGIFVCMDVEQVICKTKGPTMYMSETEYMSWTETTLRSLTWPCALCHAVDDETCSLSSLDKYPPCNLEQIHQPWIFEQTSNFAYMVVPEWSTALVRTRRSRIKPTHHVASLTGKVTCFVWDGRGGCVPIQFHCHQYTHLLDVLLQAVPTVNALPSTLATIGEVFLARLLLRFAAVLCNTCRWAESLQCDRTQHHWDPCSAPDSGTCILLHMLSVWLSVRCLISAVYAWCDRTRLQNGFQDTAWAMTLSRVSA